MYSKIEKKETQLQPKAKTRVSANTSIHQKKEKERMVS
jgi:hypothetical protein